MCKRITKSWDENLGKNGCRIDFKEIYLYFSMIFCVTIMIVLQRLIFELYFIKLCLFFVKRSTGLPGLPGKHGREGPIGFAGDKGEKGLAGLNGAPGNYILHTLLTSLLPEFKTLIKCIFIVHLHNCWAICNQVQYAIYIYRTAFY